MCRCCCPVLVFSPRDLPEDVIFNGESLLRPSERGGGLSRFVPQAHTRTKRTYVVLGYMQANQDQLFDRNLYLSQNPAAGDNLDSMVMSSATPNGVMDVAPGVPQMQHLLFEAGSAVLGAFRLVIPDANRCVVVRSFKVHGET